MPCQHDYENPIKKWRAKLYCRLCDEDITLNLVFLNQALNLISDN